MKSKLFRKMCSIALSALMIGGAAVALPQVVPGASVEVSAANSERDFYTEEVQGGIAITGYKGSSENVNIPSSIFGEKVVTIESLGNDNAKIKSIIIPNSCYSIDSGAFENYVNLKNITIPDNVRIIGSSAFSGCTSLTSVSLPKSLDAYYPWAIFQGCTSLKSITIPYGWKEIPERLLSGCTALTSVSIPDTVTTINGGAFEGCTSLKTIYLPQSITEICSSSFSGCTSLKNVKLPDALTQIPDFCFYGCPLTSELTIGKNVESIESYAFGKCQNLKKIIIPESVTYISEYAFADWNNGSTPNLIFYGKKNSYADKFANNHDIPFKALIATTGVVFNTSGISLNVNETYKITATVKPANATINTLTWKSSNTAVATVSADGTVTAKSGGTATITATTADNKSATCSVTVYGSPTSINLNASQMSLGKGETTKLTATVGPQYAKDKTVKWRTSNSKVLTVDQSGNVKAVNNGTAWITATAKGNTKLEKSCKITVKNAPSKITLTKGILTIGVGESYTVGSSVNDGAACAKRTYRTSNSSIVKMTRTDWNGVFVGVKPGVAYVTVRTYNGKESTCKVTVKAAPSKVSLNKTAMTLKVGQKGSVSAIIPSNAGCATRTFRSSNNNVVQMTKTNWTGEFVAKNKGVAYVAVKTYNGKEAYCKVTVQ